MPDKGWRRFEDPIPLPRGRQLVMVQDAAGFIMKLPKAEQKLEEWQTATGCLIGAAEGRPTSVGGVTRHPLSDRLGNLSKQVLTSFFLIRNSVANLQPRPFGSGPQQLFSPFPFSASLIPDCLFAHP
jgi:hypothetical protein